jgi:hypothetical protein
MGADAVIKTMGMIKDQCQMDIEKLATIIPPAGASQSNMLPGMGSSDTVPVGTNMTSLADFVAFTSLMSDVMAPVGELTCTKAQNMQYVKAMDKFAFCTGIDLEKKEQMMAKDDLLKVNEKCQANAIMANSSDCTEAILSDKVISGALRDLYQHPGKYCLCFQNLKAALPSCSLSFGRFIDDTNEKVPDGLDETFFRSMKLSLGFVKSELCVIGLGCDALKDVCVSQLNDLEKCLGENPGCNNEAPSTSCQASVFLSVPPQLSQGQLPDICLKAHRDNNMTSTVVSDFANFVQTCHPDVMTIAATKQNLKPRMSMSSGSMAAIVPIGIIAVAVLVFARLKMRNSRGKKQKVDLFEPLKTEDRNDADVEEFS